MVGCGVAEERSDDEIGPRRLQLSCTRAPVFPARNWFVGLRSAEAFPPRGASFLFVHCGKKLRPFLLSDDPVNHRIENVLLLVIVRPEHGQETRLIVAGVVLARGKLAGNRSEKAADLLVFTSA
jgi:hypothetical protein